MACMQNYGVLLDSLEALVLGRRPAPPGEAAAAGPAPSSEPVGGSGAQAVAAHQGGSHGGQEGAAGAGGGDGVGRAQASAAASGVQGGEAAPRCFVCFRVRQYKEQSFEEQARGRGFSVSAVPVDALHEEFRCGGWRLIELGVGGAVRGPSCCKPGARWSLPVTGDVRPWPMVEQAAGARGHSSVSLHHHAAGNAQVPLHLGSLQSVQPRQSPDASSAPAPLPLGCRVQACMVAASACCPAAGASSCSCSVASN